jgi:hypothetical protein
MIPYGTDEWFAARLGKVTASRGACLLVNGKGPYGLGEGAQTYAGEVVRGMFGIKPDDYQSADMEEGVIREPESIEAYEEATFRVVQPGGFLLMDGTIIGASPDGFVDEDGTIQAKNPRPKAHHDFLLTLTPANGYRTQVQWELMVSGRQWCDFFSYCPAFPERKRLAVVRIERDDEWIVNTLRPRIDAFLQYVEELKVKMTE